MPDSSFDSLELTVLERNLGLGRTELTVRGPLPIGWCENLSAHFVARGANVDRLVASCRESRVWEVEIALLGGRGVDVRRGVRDREAIDARLYELRMDGGHAWSEKDGSIGLEVHGRDRRGLLAALLRRLAMQGLFPVRMDVQTHGERVLDRFVLRGFSGCAPSKGRVERLLEELVHPARSAAERSRGGDTRSRFG
jgi:hypothetical protein